VVVVKNEEDKKMAGGKFGGWGPKKILN